MSSTDTPASGMGKKFTPTAEAAIKLALLIETFGGGPSAQDIPADSPLGAMIHNYEQAGDTVGAAGARELVHDALKLARFVVRNMDDLATKPILPSIPFDAIKQGYYARLDEALGKPPLTGSNKRKASEITGGSGDAPGPNVASSYENEKDTADGGAKGLVTSPAKLERVTLSYCTVQCITVRDYLVAVPDKLLWAVWTLVKWWQSQETAWVSRAYLPRIISVLGLTLSAHRFKRDRSGRILGDSVPEKIIHYESSALLHDFQKSWYAIAGALSILKRKEPWHVYPVIRQDDLIAETKNLTVAEACRLLDARKRSSVHSPQPQEESATEAGDA